MHSVAEIVSSPNPPHCSEGTSNVTLAVDPKLGNSAKNHFVPSEGSSSRSRLSTKSLLNAQNESDYTQSLRKEDPAFKSATRLASLLQTGGLFDYVNQSNLSSMLLERVLKSLCPLAKKRFLTNNTKILQQQGAIKQILNAKDTNFTAIQHGENLSANVSVELPTTVSQPTGSKLHSNNGLTCSHNRHFSGNNTFNSRRSSDSTHFTDSTDPEISTTGRTRADTDYSLDAYDLSLSLDFDDNAQKSPPQLTCSNKNTICRAIHNGVDQQSSCLSSGVTFVPTIVEVSSYISQRHQLMKFL